MRKPGKSFLLGFAAGTFLGTLLLVVFVGGGILLFQKPLTRLMAARQSARLQAPILANHEPADLKWSVQDFVGNTVQLSAFAGKPLFLHFWSTDCVACVSEIPALNRMNTALRDSGVQVATIVKGHPDELLKDFAALSVDFPVYLGNETRPKMFSPGSQPATYILDAQGKIIFSHLGSAKWDDPSCVAFLQALSAMTTESAPPGSSPAQ